MVLSRFVLVIDITGNETVPDGVILSELREAGVSLGSYGPAVDERAVANQTLLGLEELSFVSVNLRGVRAEVVVRERDPAPEVEPTGVASDLVAGKSGRILTVNALAGDPQVEVGDTVEAGEVLVSGTVEIPGASRIRARFWPPIRCSPRAASGRRWRRSSPLPSR